MVCMFSYFLLDYADSSLPLPSLSGIVAFTGFWQLACPICIHLQNSEQIRVNLPQEQSAICIQFCNHN